MQFDTLFPVHNPGKRAHPQNEILVPRKTRILGTPCLFATLSQRNAKKPTQKDTNFGNAIILHYLEPENRQIQPQKTRISHKTALIDPIKNAKESIHFSRILHIVLKCTH